MRWWPRAGALSAAENYPTSKIMDSGPECQAAMAQERPGGANPCPRSGRRRGEATQHPRPVAAGRRHPMSKVKAAAGRSHLAPEARGSDPEEPPGARGQRQQLGGATQGDVAAQAQEGLEELSQTLITL